MYLYIPFLIWIFFIDVIRIILYNKYMYFKFNIFSRAVGGRALTHPSFMEEVILMSTYEEFMVILTAGILLVSILEFAIHKK